MRRSLGIVSALALLSGECSLSGGIEAQQPPASPTPIPPSSGSSESASCEKDYARSTVGGGAVTFCSGQAAAVNTLRRSDSGDKITFLLLNAGTKSVDTTIQVGYGAAQLARPIEGEEGYDLEPGYQVTPTVVYRLPTDPGRITITVTFSGGLRAVFTG